MSANLHRVVEPMSSPPVRILRSISGSDHVILPTGRVGEAALPGSMLARQRKICDEVEEFAAGLYVGPMPPQQFLDSFLQKHSRSSLSGDVFAPMTQRCLPERVRHQAFVKCARSICPSFTIRDTLTSPDKVSQLVPSITFYGRHPSTSSSSAPLLIDLTRVETIGEIKPHDSDDPFSDDGSGHRDCPFEAKGAGTAQTRGRLSACAGAILQTQYRSYLFTFLICGEYARLVCWDYAGAIITERFKFAETDFLAEFLSRVNYASADERGWDTSVTPLAEHWPSHIAPDCILEQLRDEEPHYGDERGRVRRHREFCIMKIPDRCDPTVEKSDFLISSPPILRSHCPFGRSTRSMTAYDLQHERVVFVKQYWRTLSEQRSKEGDIYAKLQERNVRYIPEFGSGNDVRCYQSRTQEFTKEKQSWAHRTDHIAPSRLYRMSLNTIGVPLTEFESTTELIGAMRDAMTCHDDAFFTADILHCDISVGNIMINKETREGMLVDWEAAAVVNEHRTVIRDTRTGTWQFMSTQILRRPETPHSLLDDRESAIWVLVWALLLYTRHDKLSTLEDELELFNELRVYDDGPAVGGQWKLGFLVCADFDDMYTFENRQAVAKTVANITKHLSKRYLRYQPKREPDITAHKKLAELIVARGWLAESFQDLLDNGSLPKDDPACLNENASRKRKRIEAELDDDDKLRKVRKITHRDYIDTQSMPDMIGKHTLSPPPAQTFNPPDAS